MNNSEEVLLLCHSHREASCNRAIVGFPVVTSQNVTQEVSNVGQKMFCRPTSARWILSVRSAGLDFLFLFFFLQYNTLTVPIKPDLAAFHSSPLFVLQSY